MESIHYTDASVHTLHIPRDVSPSLCAHKWHISLPTPQEGRSKGEEAFSQTRELMKVLDGRMGSGVGQIVAADCKGNDSKCGDYRPVLMAASRLVSSPYT